MQQISNKLIKYLKSWIEASTTVKLRSSVGDALNHIKTIFLAPSMWIFVLYLHEGPI